jgi:hypothetical protein
VVKYDIYQRADHYLHRFALSAGKHSDIKDEGIVYRGFQAVYNISINTDIKI